MLKAHYDHSYSIQRRSIYPNVLRSEVTHLNTKPLSLYLGFRGFPSFCCDIKLFNVMSLYLNQFTRVCKFSWSSSSVGYGDTW